MMHSTTSLLGRLTLVRKVKGLSFRFAVTVPHVRSRPGWGATWQSDAVTDARRPPTEMEPNSSVLAQAWAASAEVVRFDERVHGRPVPMPGVLLWREVITDNQHASAETIAVARLVALGAQLPHDVEVDAALVKAASTIERFRDAVDQPPNAVADLDLGRRPDLPPLAEAALLFAALEAEAAGTGPDAAGLLARRVQLHRLLRVRGLTRNTILPLASGVEAQPGGIAAVIAAWNRGSGEEPTLALIASAQHAFEAGRCLAVGLERLHDEWVTRIGARHDSSAWRLADLLIEQPVVNAAVVSTSLDVTPTAARTSIATLVEAGVLEPLSAARRNQAWRAPAVLAAAEAVLDGNPAGSRRPGSPTL